jgi:hypothetical protein
MVGLVMVGLVMVGLVMVGMPIYGFGCALHLILLWKLVLRNIIEMDNRKSK